jgi:hypothetical protein
MTDDSGSRFRRAAFAACLFLAASSSFAQNAPPAVTFPDSSEFFPRYDFHITGDALSANDPRFTWDTQVGGNFDAVDYVRGRVTILADYQAVLGRELRPFDPNQGNYTLEFGASGRVGSSTELFAMFHHVSRHLGDRAKTRSIAWNVVEARAYELWIEDRTRVEIRADAGKVVQNSWVDYTWTGDLDVLVRQTINDHVGVYARGYGEVFGVNQASTDSPIPSRGTQAGGRAEGGVRFIGQGGAIELFVGFERVVDADAFQAVPLSWAFAGFRIAH